MIVLLSMVAISLSLPLSPPPLSHSPTFVVNVFLQKGKEAKNMLFFLQYLVPFFRCY